ncbi:unnamed protein product [Brachionus calyciflorus]|uniref:Integrase catalytic domain-containing protein n=1 Tax=Brachionus calyciflorus TaxID=104777 RepID=A0A814AX40_9BILA|nr:unnamed protein product [Brachionus calyciflorus]
MKNKSAEEVCYGLKRFVFPYFGLPNIFQCENGTEFKNSLVKNLIQNWEGDCKMVHGRPRHPQSQGLVEQANGTVERMLATHNFIQEKVTVLIPKIDRGGSDLPRLPGIISRKTGEKDVFHEIVSILLSLSDNK